MNARPPSPEPREWDAQEQGRRLGNAGRIDDPDIAAYRQIASALRTQPLSSPPADFAASVVAAAAREDRRLERVLSQGLLCVFVLAGAVLTLVYGLQGWPALVRGIGGDAAGWLLAAGGCIGLSWLLRRVLALPSAPGPARR